MRVLAPDKDEDRGYVGYEAEDATPELDLVTNAGPGPIGHVNPVTGLDRHPEVLNGDVVGSKVEDRRHSVSDKTNAALVRWKAVATRRHFSRHSSRCVDRINDGRGG